MSDHLLYGAIPSVLGLPSSDALQLSPLMPGAAAIEDIARDSASSATLLAPPGTIERRYLLAQALRVLRADGELFAMAPRDKGGARLRRELEGFGCVVAEDARKHWRICRADVPAEPFELEAALEAGGPQRQAGTGLWTQAGIFSWDRIDEGTASLLAALPPLSGHGADLGCGLGLLTQAALTSDQVIQIDAVDLDGRAIAAARRNVTDPRARFHWHDLREPLALANLDFVLMNPPFHAGGREDIDLGRIFLRQSHAMLRAGGVLWMVANRHLPYEAELGALFPHIEAMSQSSRFKIYRARK